MTSKIVEFHCECQECGGITVFARDMKYAGDRPQVHLPFSVDEGSWKCGGCGIVWGFELQVYNATKEFGAEEGDMPLVEGRADIGRMKAGEGGGLSIG